MKRKKGQCIIYDEAFTGYSSRSSLSPINRVLVSLAMQIRQKNLFIIIILPIKCYLKRFNYNEIAKKAKLVVDIGSDIGLFAYFSSIYASKANIHLFEADPETYKVLCKNVRNIEVVIKNSTRHIYSNHCCVGEHDGSVFFYSANVSGWSSRYPVLGALQGKQVTIPMIKLSDYLKKKDISSVDLLKIDVEGGEYEILLGDRELWNVDIKSIVLEIDRTPRCNSKYKYSDLMRFLHNKFFRVSKLGGKDYQLFYCDNFTGRCS